MEIKHDLLPKQKTRKHNLRVEIDLYPYATELYEELDKIGMPHICHHTYCSNMAKSGMNPKTLQYLMGHSNIGVTLNTYTQYRSALDGALFLWKSERNGDIILEVETLLEGRKFDYGVGYYYSS